jgi:hypothetical protein
MGTAMETAMVMAMETEAMMSPFFRQLRTHVSFSPEPGSFKPIQI